MAEAVLKSTKTSLPPATTSKRFQPKLRDLTYVLKEVDWHELGIQLNVPSYILRNIDRENPGNESRKLSEVLQFCRENGDSSWEKIVEALQRIGGHGNIISNIQSEYMTREPSPDITDETSSSKSKREYKQLFSSASEDANDYDGDQWSGDQSLEEILSRFSCLLLDSPCTDAHLVKLSRSVTDLQTLAYFLRLREEEDIYSNLLNSNILSEWKKKFGKQTIYRYLIIALYEANQIDLIRKLKHITTLQPLPLELYGLYLKKQYVEVLFTTQVSARLWLPSPTSKIFNLAIIKKEAVQRGKIDDEFVQKSIRGQVDDILLRKSPIELKNLFNNISGERKVILIDGAPGSGKSTLTVHICRQWGRGELFDEFTVVIFVQLRDPKVQSAKSIADLLPCKDSEMAKQTAQEIKAIEGSGVLWIMDGWDELPSHLQEKSIVSALIKPTLYQENTLLKTAVIVTSRPISSGNLTYVVSSRIEVLGFTAEEQRLFFTECLNNDQEAVDNLIERLSRNPIMEGSCYLPLNASIVAHLYLTNGCLPSTFFGLFSSLVQHFLSRYLYERKGISLELATFESLDGLPSDLQPLFQQLCELAFSGARDNKVTFSSDELRASNEVSELGLLQAVPSIVSHGRTVYYNFLHLSIQEMLAAIYISQMPAADQIKTFDSMLNAARFSAVLQFYAAVTKLRTSRPLLTLVPQFMRPVPASVYDLIRKIIKKDTKSLCVSIMNCLYEAQDISLCKFVARQLKKRISYLDRLRGHEKESNFYLYGYSFLPNDCFSIGYFLASIAVICKGVFSVWLRSCSLGDASTKILMQSLGRELSNHRKTTGHLSIDLYGNDITSEGTLYIADVLKSFNVLRELHLYSNPIQSRGLMYIAEALITNKSLVILVLSKCSLTVTETNGPTLLKMLQQNNSLRSMNLSANSGLLSCQNSKSFLISGLKQNTTLKTLELSECGIVGGLSGNCNKTCEIIIKSYWHEDVYK